MSEPAKPPTSEDVLPANEPTQPHPREHGKTPKHVEERILDEKLATELEEIVENTQDK